MSFFFHAFKYWILAGLVVFGAIAAIQSNPMVVGMLFPILVLLYFIWRMKVTQPRDQQLAQYSRWWGTWESLTGTARGSR